MISESGKQILASTSKVKVAHLVEIELAGTSGEWNYLTDNYDNITFGGKVYLAGRVKQVGSVKITQGLTNYKLDVTVAAEFQEELDKATTDESYEGKKIRVYKAMFDDSGEIQVLDSQTGGPLVLFEGTITNIGLKDSILSGSSTVTWSCAGSLQDFEKVNGRLTDDAQHRALESSGELGTLVPGAGAKREEYKTDTGFLHSNQTVAASLSYLTTETEYYFKKKWHGLGGDLRTREVEVTKELELSTSLSSKYLPVVYGVRRVSGVPVFLDANAEDPSIVYVVYAVCEGEIQSFLNVYVEGVSAICAPGGNTAADGVCMGNTADGDTLSFYKSASSASVVEDNWKKNPRGLERHQIDVRDPIEPDLNRPPQPAPSAIERSAGTSHGMVMTIAAQDGPIKMTFYHGKSDQLPDPLLVELAKDNKFFLQRQLRKPDGSPWGPEYWADASTGVSGAALLDTAYVVAEFRIGEDRSTIPELEFVVDGRMPRVYSDPVTYTVERTLNPVWHILDYCTTSRFGGELSYDDFDLASLVYTASKLNEVDGSYDASFVKMWRYIGWDDATGPLSRIQCNSHIDTSVSITKNVEELLSHFEGTLHPLSGKYYMSLETDDSTIADLTIDELAGGVTINNKANKDKWNSIQASLQDPALNWSSNQVSFFNSNYLEEDNNIRKQGRATFSQFTNYYTARAWAEYLLDVSRFSKTLRMTTYYKYMYLKPNDNITFTYPRYGYVEGSNKFRVVEVDIQSDGLVGLTLERYDSSAFSPTTQSPVGQEDSLPEPKVAAPSNLEYINLPNLNYPVSTPEGEICALLIWDPLDPTSVMRYELEMLDGIVQVPKSNTISTPQGEKVFYLVTGLQANETREYKVCTVNTSGFKSEYSIVVGTSNGGVFSYLPPMTGLTVANSDANGNFTGKDVLIKWDEYPLQNIDGLQFEVLTSDQVSTVYNTTFTPEVTEFNFTYSLNKSRYAALNGNALGVYRGLTFRIRAYSGTLGGEFNSSEWRVI